MQDESVNDIASNLGIQSRIKQAKCVSDYVLSEQTSRDVSPDAQKEQKIK